MRRHEGTALSNPCLTPLNDITRVMTEAPPTRPEKKRPSGAQNRKKKRERERLEREARMMLLKAQGKMIEADTAAVTWKPRPHQTQIEEAFQRGILRQAHVWHRRAGKSAACLDFMVKRALERPGNYWFLTPKLSQTRTAIWQSRRSDGIREIDIHAPADIRTNTLEREMQIDLINGSMIKFLGSDGFDRLVGSNVHGIIFDEFARADPAAWDYLSPILVADPMSWALFISTYRGKNHWFRLVKRVKGDPAWHTSDLTIADTCKEDGSAIVSPEDIEAERREGKAEAYIQQEYYNDPLAAFDGAYYGAAMRVMQDDRRIGSFAYDPRLPVSLSVDLGIADELVFVFWQRHGNEEWIIGSRSWKFTEIKDALEDVRLVFPWGKRPMTVILPHDGRFGTGDVFELYGYDPVILPRTRSVSSEIEAVRGFLGLVRIDNDVRNWTDNDNNNARLIEALCGYRVEKSKTDADAYQQSPAHSWESHFADAVRYHVVAANSEMVGATTWGPSPNYEQHDRIARVVA